MLSIQKTDLTWTKWIKWAKLYCIQAIRIIAKSVFIMGEAMEDAKMKNT